MPSAKKLSVDIDTSPWSWPPASHASLAALCESPSPHLESRGHTHAKSGRKRKLLTFSEVTDAFVEGSVKSEKDAWMLAKVRKMSGDDTLFNTLGATACVRTLVGKVRNAWSCEEMSTGTLTVKPAYDLTRFLPVENLGADVVAWARGGWKRTALFLYGDAGLGKTEFACALMHTVAPAKVFHFVNKLDRLRDVLFAPGEGLVFDEAYYAACSIDDFKGIVDVEKGRDVACRHKDGTIPAGTPRIFSTNWPREQMLPREALGGFHGGAVCRRMLWVDVKADLRKDTAPTSDSQSPRMALPLRDEDPFGWDCSLG